MPEEPESLSPAYDQLVSARHAGNTSVRVQFFDGLTGLVDMSKFGLDITRLRLPTARADGDGSAVEIEDVDGDVFDIDASVFRSHLDPHYAAELAAVIADYYARGGETPPPKA